MTPRRLSREQIPDGTPERIAGLLADGRAELVTPDAETIVALWTKARRSLLSSMVSQIDCDTAIDAAYKSLLQGAMALHESEGYRIGGSTGGHHRDTFYAAAGLGYERLAELDVETEFVRRLRSASVYQSAGPWLFRDQGKARRRAGEFLMAARLALRIRSRLAAPGDATSVARVKRVSEEGLMTSLGYFPEAAAAVTAAPHHVLPSPFDSPDGEAAYLAAYDANMRFWPVPYDPLDISTRFGITHVVACGPLNAPPLVLLHGYGGALTMWWPNVAELSRDYRVYAVDVIGQAGRSIPDQPVRSRADYVEWMTALLAALGIERSFIVGMSYGGWLTLNFAIAAPERVTKIALLSPASGFLPLVDEFFQRGMRMAATPTRELTDDFMAWVAGADRPSDPDLRARYDGLMDQFHLGVKHFRGVPNEPVVSPVPFTDDELRAIRVPTLLLLGDRDPIYDTAAALDRARRLVPGLEGGLIPGAGHMMCFTRATTVDERILEFFARGGSAAGSFFTNSPGALP
jgi:pimeloyl-ACP methyl ester carboxylesterase